MSSIVNKVKEAVSGHHDHSSAPEGTHGTHNSRVANAADPRIDSDRDHRAAPGSTVGGTHEYTTSNNYSHTGPTGSTTGAYDAGPTSGYSTGTTGAYGSSREGEHGPHSSRIANAVDPRVDSDRDASRTVGGNNYGSSATHGTTGAYGSTGREGPHNSNLANKMDPRIDSDRSGQRMGNTAGDYYGSSGTHGTTGAHGTHGATHGTHQLGGNYAPGPAPNTAGPHKSDALNKADPRVDSDLDGSKTYGSNKTYGV
ncbi:hypothetical protein RRF57_004865 [Xylaria bambusicola]|uniref:Cell surface protein n=1 Tax=Xylaria bambusicola TaxID=326684 RepID=A0AAN7YXC1_9PEZI